MTHTTQLTHHIQRCFGKADKNKYSKCGLSLPSKTMLFCLSDFLMSRSKKEKQEIPSNWSMVVEEVGLLVKVVSLHV